MIRRGVLRFLGISFIFIGVLLIINSAQIITGFVIFEDADISYSSIVGIWFVISGIVVLFAEANIVRERQGREGLVIMISNKAIQRSKRDRTVRDRLRRYQAEIDKIAADPSSRPQEIIGDFHISPRGHNDIRVAWHIENGILYIDDLLYHERGNTYINGWNKKASSGEIRKKDYELVGYSPRE